MTTSGSSGRKGLFVYDRSAWVATVALYLRYTAMVGLRPRVPRRRVAAIGGGALTHMSRRLAASVGPGVHRVCSLPVTMPLDRMVAALNAFGPDFVNVYPSMAGLLAEEQRAGRLRISLTAMSTSSEMRPPELTERIAEAFGVRPYNVYSTTEGLAGCSCEHDAGIHLFEDTVVVENVDARGRPVAPGERGAKIFVTSLVNRAQPVIRLEVSDVMALDPEPCPCGRTLVRARAVDGRADDVLHLAGRDGESVAVHPMQFAVVTADRDVREFQVVQEGERLRLRVALASDASRTETCARLRMRVTERLEALGVREPVVDVEPAVALERPPDGKLRMIVADRGGS